MTDEDRAYYSLVKRVFAALAPVYDILTWPFCGLRQQVVRFLPVPEHCEVLDVATGTGQQAFAFAKQGHDVTGIDVSDSMLRVARAKNRYRNLRFVQADATGLPFQDARFDLSCVSFALHDMPSSIRARTLTQIGRVTRPNGAVVIIDYGLPRNRFAGRLVRALVSLYEGKYYSDFIDSDLNGMLQSAGIEIEDELRVLGGVARILRGRKVRCAVHVASSAGTAGQA